MPRRRLALLMVRRSKVIVGVPTEIKASEGRVAITPTGVRELVSRGHRVLVESQAGEGSTIHDAEYATQGAEIVPSAEDVFDGADLILKVKEPQPVEVERFRPGQIVFTYLHLAAYPTLAKGLAESGVVGIAYETVQLADRSLPLLAPMSEIAGRMATQAGAYFLERAQGGRGILLGGVPGVAPGKVVVIGAGIAGTNAAVIAVGMQAEVVALDRDLSRLRAIDSLYQGRIVTLASNQLTLEQQVEDADLVIGSVLVPGASAPRLVTEQMVAEHEAGGGPGRHRHRPGRLLRDQPGDHPRGPGLLGARRRPLRGGQHPRSRAQHLHLRPDQRHHPLCLGAGRPRRAARRSDAIPSWSPGSMSPTARSPTGRWPRASARPGWRPRRRWRASPRCERRRSARRATSTAAVTEYLGHLSAERGLSGNTVAAYRRDLTGYLEHLDGAAPNRELVDSFVKRLSMAGLAPSTVARKTAAVRGLHRFHGGRRAWRPRTRRCCSTDPPGGCRCPRRWRSMRPSGWSKSPDMTTAARQKGPGAARVPLRHRCPGRRGGRSGPGRPRVGGAHGSGHREGIEAASRAAGDGGGGGHQPLPAGPIEPAATRTGPGRALPQLPRWAAHPPRGVRRGAAFGGSCRARRRQGVTRTSSGTRWRHTWSRRGPI